MLRTKVASLCCLVVFSLNSFADDDLIEAAKTANNKKIQQLLKTKHKAINDVNSAGETALLQVGETGDIQSYKILTAAGADINFADRSNQTTLYYAIANGHSELALQILRNSKLLLDAKIGFKKENILFIAAEKGNLAVITAILKKNKLLAIQKNSDSKTAHQIAADFAQNKAAQLILRLSSK